MSKKKKQQVIDAFKSADKNGDGKIDLEEYVQHFKVIFYFFKKYLFLLGFFIHCRSEFWSEFFKDYMLTLPFLWSEEVLKNSVDVWIFQGILEEFCFLSQEFLQPSD